MPRNLNKIDYAGGLPESFESFFVIEDPRTGGNKRKRCLRDLLDRVG